MNDQLERVKTALEIVRYRPGWTITAHPCPFGPRVWVLIDAEVPDAEKGHRFHSDFDSVRTTRIGVRAVVPEFDDDDIYYLDRFYDWLGWRLKRVERHESREFFWVGDGPWDGPHKVPQPKHDYIVRKVDGEWQVQSFDGTTVVMGTNTWRYAYEKAWSYVIADDLAKGEDMING